MFFLAFSLVVREMPEYNSQRRGTARTLPELTVFYVLLTASVVWWLACWPLVPEFAGSIPTEAVEFFPM
jgi:hypothetical protein